MALIGLARTFAKDFDVVLILAYVVAAGLLDKLTLLTVRTGLNYDFLILDFAMNQFKCHYFFLSYLTNLSFT